MIYKIGDKVIINNGSYLLLNQIGIIQEVFIEYSETLEAICVCYKIFTESKHTVYLSRNSVSFLKQPLFKYAI